jgi:MFS family permease
MMAAILAVQIGNGLAGLTISLRTETQGLDAALTGWIIGAFYAGQIFGSMVPPFVLKWTGLKPAYFLFTGVAGLSVAGFVATDDPYVWIALRFLQGLGFSSMFATVESWLNLGTDDKWRARTFAVYIIMQLLGLCLGQLAINAGDGFVVSPLLIAGFMIGGSGAMLLFAALAEPHIGEIHILSPVKVFRRSPGGAVAIVIAGLLWAQIMGMGPIYAERMGLTHGQVSIFTALAVLGGMASQFPLGHWADHSQRRMVLAVMAGIAASLSVLAFLIVDREAILLWVLAAAFGAMTFPAYAIAVAFVNEQLIQEERIAASAAMGLFFGLGATTAPFLTAYAMNAAGPVAFFVVTAYASAGLVLVLLLGQRHAYETRT